MRCRGVMGWLKGHSFPPMTQAGEDYVHLARNCVRCGMPLNDVDDPMLQAHGELDEATQEVKALRSESRLRRITLYSPTGRTIEVGLDEIDPLIKAGLVRRWEEDGELFFELTDAGQVVVHAVTHDEETG